MIMETDQRSPERRANDERIAAQAPMAGLDLPPGTTGVSVETHLARQRKAPLAIEGVVENGRVRPLDPSVKLPERSRVLIVAAHGGGA